MSTLPCRAPWDGVVVHFSGVVYPCDQMADGKKSVAMQLGDLNQQSFDEIIHGRKAQELRRRVLHGDLEGLLCETCDKIGTCNLYGDPVNGEDGGNWHGGAGPQSRIVDLNALPMVRMELGLTDLCNMKCIMCSLSWGEASPFGVRKNGFMDLEIAHKAISGLTANAGEERPLLMLHWIGEPLIHPQIKEILKIDNWRRIP